MDLGTLWGSFVGSFWLLFCDLGQPGGNTGSRVGFLGIWAWKSPENTRLGCAETIVNTVVFVRFHIFMFFVNWVSTWRLLDLILVGFWVPGAYFF